MLFLDTVHESSVGATTTISDPEPARPANDGDDATYEGSENVDKELANLDKEFAESIGATVIPKPGESASEKPKVDKSKAPDATPAPDPNQVETYTPEEIAALKNLSPKLLAKFPNLQRYLGQGRGVEDVLGNYNQNINDLMWLRAVSGRTGIPIDQLRTQVEMAVTNFNRAPANNAPEAPKAVEIDDATLTVWADRLGMTKDQTKELFGVMQKFVPQSQNKAIEDKLAAIENHVAQSQAKASENLWNSYYDMAAKSPQSEKIFQAVKRDALDAIISQYEAAAPGFSQNWINRGQNPYSVALKLYMAEFASPEQFLASIGAQEVSKTEVPTIQQPRGSSGAPGQKTIGEMTTKELSEFIRKQAGDNSFQPFDEGKDEF